MKKVLLIGQDPASVDFLDPALLPGMNVEGIRSGIDVALRQITDSGWLADLCLVQANDSAVTAVQSKLSAATYDCVVIGGGICRPVKNLLVFEAIINAIHRSSGGAHIALVMRPEDTASAAARWLNKH